MKWTALLLIVLVASCRPSTGKRTPETSSPAEVENAVTEGDLATVTLTPRARDRLGIATEPVDRRTVPRFETLGGEIVAPPGASVTVSAPLAGLLKPIDQTTEAGLHVESGAPLIQLLPLVAPESHAQLVAAKARAEGAITQAKVKLEAARVVLTRAERLLSDKAGSAREVDNAKADVAFADASLKAAMAENAALERTLGDLEAGVASAIPITSPIDGVLMRIHAGPGQQVPAGAALYEILDTTLLWVRVPVYVGDLSSLAVDSDVRVGPLSGRSGGPGSVARPVAAPPTANASASSTDLFYALERNAENWRPGQRVAVTIPLVVPEEALVVPWKAVLFDFLGGSWVYEETSDRVFVRRPVEVLYVEGMDAVLSRGPQPGTKVVTVGTMEIFGTEFPTWK